MNSFVTCLMTLCCVGTTMAHDSWVETNTNLVRSGDAVYIDLKLGNHGNDHRDFKIAGKLDLQKVQIGVVDPEGKRFDLKPEALDLGYAPKEGYYSMKFSAFKPGIYTVCETSDYVVDHGQLQRSLKTAKTFFQISESLDKPVPDDRIIGQSLGHPFEFVPTVNPILPMAAGRPVQVKLLLRGEPVEGVKVSCIPQGVELRPDFDDEYERLTDKDGLISFTPKFGARYLFVSHLILNESGDDFEATKYTATLTLFVPELCTCCE